jgi:uncharacterized protein with GYD domain
MQTYIVCYKYTDTAIVAPGGTRNRLPLLKKDIVERGGEMLGFYLTMGQFDTVAVVRFPNADVASKFVLSSISKGYVETTTMRAFEEPELIQIIKELPQ